MGFHYGHNRKKMEEEFAKIAAACRAEGMPEEKIEMIHRLLLDILNNDRRFYVHTQSYDGLQFADGEEAEEGRSPLLTSSRIGSALFRWKSANGSVWIGLRTLTPRKLSYGLNP